MATITELTSETMVAKEVTTAMQILELVVATGEELSTGAANELYLAYLIPRAVQSEPELMLQTGSLFQRIVHGETCISGQW